MGGKWIIRLRKGLASRCWENLILAMLGEQFMVGEEICGAVVSVRFQVHYTHTHTRTHTRIVVVQRICAICIVCLYCVQFSLCVKEKLDFTLKYKVHAKK